MTTLEATVAELEFNGINNHPASMPMPGDEPISLINAATRPLGQHYIETAHTYQRHIADAVRQYTSAWIRLGRRLCEFDDGGYWAYVPNPEYEDEYGFTSFNKWLNYQGVVAVSTARTVMQAYRACFIELGLSYEDVYGVDPSKFTELNPELRRISDEQTQRIDRVKELTRQAEDELPDGIAPQQRAEDLARLLDNQQVPTVDAVRQAAKQEAMEWIEHAKTASRDEIRKKRADSDGWAFKTLKADDGTSWAKIIAFLRDLAKGQAEVYLTVKYRDKVSS